MSDRDNTIDVLNQLLAVECSSLARYLAGTSPWHRSGEERAAVVLEQIVADQEYMAGRIAELIFSRGGLPESCVFPMEYTDLHMLSFDYLVREMIRGTQRDIRAIEACRRRLAHDREAVALAEEVLGSERGHLESLEELVAPPVA